MLSIASLIRMTQHQLIRISEGIYECVHRRLVDKQPYEI
jgi:hypothetical protein